MREALFGLVLDSMIDYEDEKLFCFQRVIVFLTLQPKLHNTKIERKGISDDDMVLIKSKGRGRGKLFITGRGIIDYISKKRILDKISVEMLISKLKELQIIDPSLYILRNFKERGFEEELTRFFSYFEKDVKKQYPYLNYSIDFLIDDVAIEFERDCKTEYENKREELILKKYKLIKIRKINTLAENLAIIAKEVLK